MYITNTTEQVKKMIDELDKQDDLSKLKFLIYIFDLLNNNQINDKNVENPDMMDDDEIEIFTLQSVGLSVNACTILLQYFVMLYNGLTDTNDAYEDNGSVLGINYNDNDVNLISQFEKFTFNEKLDVFSEVIIKYDNESFFKEKITIMSFDSKSNGYDLAHLIQEMKV